MSQKRSLDLKELREKKARTDAKTAPLRETGPRNPYLNQPVQPEKHLQTFLLDARNKARAFLPKELQTFPVRKPFCEIECRLGMLKIPQGQRRVTSTGAKHVQGILAKAFDCSAITPRPQMVAGISRSHYMKWTSAGISETSPLSQALGATNLKQDLEEVEYIETVFSGYDGDRRVCYPGLHSLDGKPMTGKMESKQRLSGMDLTVPASPYDIRISLATEKALDTNVPHQPPPGWSQQRIKRRRSYTRRDKSIAWQIDVTEVTSTGADGRVEVDYEIEMELRDVVMLQLINEEKPESIQNMTNSLAQQLWWILSQINPLHDALDVEECLRDHPNKQAVTLALAQCGYMKQFMDNGGKGEFQSPIARPDQSHSHLCNVKFIGCMPVNFCRHHIDEIQRSASNAYYCSEKTDGVRHFLVFTGETAVLVDRAMRGKQPILPEGSPYSDPFQPILPLIKPGTVFDGEVVMNRRGRKPRPIFIVFDVMAISITQPVLQLPFEKRLEHIQRATFGTSKQDMFNPAMVSDLSVPLPLVRKNFVQRTSVDTLLNFVVEERGMRCYRNGDLHNHLTDGIIFQPNLPYVCGTDVHLLKWKYLDTVTIDVEILPLLPSDDDNVLRLGCLGEEQTRVDMTRHIILPSSERMKLEADRYESGGRIAEVGFDPETGEWYYLTMRADKIAPNHISTVLGSLMELGESLTTDELRYRMSVPPGHRDTYRKDMRRMLTQLLDYQRKSLQRR